MNMNLKGISSAAAIAAVGMFISASSAKASFELMLTDTTPGCSGTCTFTITDNGAGDTNPVTGVITVTGGNSDFAFSLTTGTSKPVLTPAQLALSSIDITSNSPNASLRLELSDTGFTTPGSTLAQQLSYTSGTNATITSTGYAGAGGTDFDLAQSTGSVSLSSAPSGQGSSAAVTLGSTYSLTEVVTVDFTGAAAGSSANLTAALQVVPEPASVALFGGTLLVLGTVIRRRARRA
jgi:hypothetical protein